MGQSKADFDIKSLLETCEKLLVRKETHTVADPHTENPFRYIQSNLISPPKMYSDDLKYGREGDCFDYKHGIFVDSCEKIDLPRDSYFKALSTMLKGAVSKHNYIAI